MDEDDGVGFTAKVDMVWLGYDLERKDGEAKMVSGRDDKGSDRRRCLYIDLLPLRRPTVACREGKGPTYGTIKFRRPHRETTVVP